MLAWTECQIRKCMLILALLYVIKPGLWCLRYEYAIKPLIFKIRLYELVPRSIERIFSNMPRDTWLQAAVVLSADWSIYLLRACAWWRKTKVHTTVQRGANKLILRQWRTNGHPSFPALHRLPPNKKKKKPLPDEPIRTDVVYVACTGMNLESWTQATMGSVLRLLGFSTPLCFRVSWAWKRSNRRKINFLGKSKNATKEH